MDLLDGLTVLVSGSGPGLGRATAAAVLREGGRVVLGDLDEARARAVQDEFDPSGDRSAVARMDITSDEDCSVVVELARARFGSLQGLVHVAALDTVVGGMLEGGFEDLERTHDVNVIGTMRLTRAAVPLLEIEGGSVVVINSVGGFRPRANPLRFAYGTSKGALLTAARYLAAELGPRRIRVNSIAPGFKWGPALEQYFRDEAPRRGVTFESMVAEMSAEVALGELADDDDIADAAVFFLSRLAKRVTGQTLVVDAGGYYH